MTDRPRDAEPLGGHNPKKDFFISFTKADRPWADWIAWELEAAGYSVEYQGWDFLPGEDFVVEMNRALQRCRRLVAVLSPDYLDSPFAASEWSAFFAADATGEQRKLMPVRVREVDPTGLLSGRIYLDLVGLGETEAKETLIRGMEGRLKPSKRPPFPATEGRSERPLFPPAAETRPADETSKSGAAPSSEPNPGASVRRSNGAPLSKNPRVVAAVIVAVLGLAGTWFQLVVLRDPPRRAQLTQVRGLAAEEGKPDRVELTYETVDEDVGVAKIELWVRSPKEAVWQATGRVRTAAEGTFEFAGLSDSGRYNFDTVTHGRWGKRSHTPEGDGQVDYEYLSAADRSPSAIVGAFLDAAGESTSFQERFSAFLEDNKTAIEADPLLKETIGGLLTYLEEERPEPDQVRDFSGPLLISDFDLVPRIALLPTTVTAFTSMRGMRGAMVTAKYWLAADEPFYFQLPDGSRAKEISHTVEISTQTVETVWDLQLHADPPEAARRLQPPLAINLSINGYRRVALLTLVTDETELVTRPLAGQRASCDRATKMTIRRVLDPAAANEYCRRLTDFLIPPDYEGPHDDKTVSARTDRIVQTRQGTHGAIWCNCMPIG